MPSKVQTLSLDALHEHMDRQFFPRGKAQTQSVGLELEICPFRETKDNPAELVPFYNEEGTGLIQCLRKLEITVPGLDFAPTDSGMPRFKVKGGGQITFEPGGQLEYSGPPMDTLSQAISDITELIEVLRCGLKTFGIWLFHSGLNPWYKLEDVPLQLDAPRYINMNNFFKAIGPYGQRMMRLSTGLQVNLDTGTPDQAQRRWLAANLLSPIFTTIFGNSPFVEGRPTGAYSYRSLIWQNLDSSRTGFPKGFLDEPYCPCPVNQYVQTALDAWVMRLPDGKGGMTFDGNFKTFKQWWSEGHNGYFPELSDWETHLSTMFLEIRVRGFFETRFLDAQSKVWCSVPGILLTHLLYDEDATEKVIDLLQPYRPTLPGMLEVGARKGMDDSELASLAKRIYRLGLEKAAKAEDPQVVELCERFYGHYTHRNMNPGAELARLNDGDLVTPAQYRAFEAAQVESAGDILSIICEYN